MLEFLAQIGWREAWLALEAAGRADLPPFLGSTLRGALGHLLRSQLCETRACGHNCQQPDACRYFALFEQSRSASGLNAPKPIILIAPYSPMLETITLGGPINLPFRSAPPATGEPIPILRDDGHWLFEPGNILRFGIRVIGPLAAALPAMLDAIGRHGLVVAGTPFHLRAAHDRSGALLFDHRFPEVPAQLPVLQQLSVENEPARRIRIVFLTPTVVKIGCHSTFDPQDLAARFFEHAMVRAARLHQILPGQSRQPWLEPPRVDARVEKQRMFRYLLPRHSYRQEKWLDFDGVVGFIELTGKLADAMPYARAAEVFHFGQKATFGLGQIRVLVLE